MSSDAHADAVRIRRKVILPPRDMRYGRLQRLGTIGDSVRHVARRESD